MRKQKWVAMLALFLLVFQLVSPIGTAWASENGILLPPSNPAYESTTPDDGRLVWSEVFGATGYNIYQITEGQLILLDSPTTNSYSLTNMAEGTYTYVVSTLSTTGESGPGVPINVTIEYPTMEAPSSVSHSIQNGNDIVLNWPASSYAENYHVFQHGEDGTTNLVTSTPSLTYTIVNAEEGTYTYSISAEHSLYGESTQTAPLEVTLSHPVMEEPKNITFQITNGNDLTLTWEAVSYANQYAVYQIVEGEEVLKDTVTTTSTKFTDMPDGDYVYKIYAISDRFGVSTGSEIPLTVSPVVMEAPSTATAKVQNINDVTLNWTAVPYATAYRIYQVTDGEKELKGTYSTLSASFQKVAGGDYTFEIYSYSDRFGESANGAVVKFTVATVTMVQPANFTAKVQNLNDIVLTWSPAANAENYKVYQIVDGERTFKTTITGTSTTFTNLPSGDYVFEVTANSTRFGESPATDALKVTLEPVIIEKPTNLNHIIQNGNDIVLKWDAAANATNYHVYQVINGQKINKYTGTATTVTFQNSPAGEYNYLVYTYNSRFGESSEGAELTVNLVHPTILSPTGVAYDITSPTSFKLSWDAADYATNYKVYQITSDSKVYKNTYSTTNASFSNMAPGEYTFEIHTNTSRFGESKLGSRITVVLTGQEMEAPGNFKHTITSGNDIKLSWDAVPYADGYKVYKVANGERTLLKTQTALNITYGNQPEGDYHYEVTSYSRLLGESLAAEVKFTLTYPKMEKPNNFTSSISSFNNVILKWELVQHANEYRVYEVKNGEEILLQKPTSNSVTLSRVTEGTHTYVVRSYSSRFGESAEASETTVEITFPEIAAPVNLTHTILNGNDIKLSWDVVSYATSYKIFRVNGESKELVQTVSGTTHTFTNQPQGDYSFEVISSSNLYGDSEQGSTVTVSVVFPTMQKPNNVTATIEQLNDIRLKWAKADFTTSYKIYEIINGEQVLQKTTSSQEHLFSIVSEGTHTYRIYSSSTRFGDSQEGSTVEVTIIYPELLPPATVSHTLPNGNDIKLTWPTAAYATSYRVYQVVNGEKILKKTLNGATTTSTTFENMPEGDYTYEVQTVSSRYGESEDTSKLSFTLVFPEMQPPADLTKSIQNGNDIILTWKSSTYATSYKVYQVINGEKKLLGTTTSTSVTYTNQPEAEYHYEIHSFSNRFGESKEPSKLIFDLIHPIMQAPAPAATYTITNGNDITLKWGTATYANSYNVYQIVDGTKTLTRTLQGSTLSLPNQKEGEYQFEIHSVSDRFGESHEPAIVSFNLVFPIMQAPPATYSITSGNDINLSWSKATYTTSYHVYQMKNGGKELVKTLSSNSTTIKFDIMPEGDYEYIIHSFSDRFGESPVGSTVSFNLKWPVVPPPVLKGNIFNANNVELQWNAISYATEYRVYALKGEGKELIYSGTGLSYKVYNLTEETHSFQIEVYSNRFGVYAESNVTEHTIVYPDMASPVANVTVLSPTSARITWNFVTYANGYNIYEVENGKAVLIAEKVNNLSYTVQNLSYKNHWYYVTSYSNSFGESDPSASVMAKLINDIVPPVTTTDYTDGWKNKSQKITLSATDDETGVAKTYYSVNEGSFVEGTSFTITEEGIHKLSYYSIDKTGNKEAVKTIEVKIDKTAPVTSVPDAPTAWVKEDVLVNLVSSDTSSKVAKTYYSINGGDYVEGNSFTVEQEGVNVVSYYSVDHAGNQEEVQTIEVKIDKAVPSTAAIGIPTNWVKENVSINLQSEDQLSTVANTYYSINGGAYIEGTSFSIEKEGVNQVSFYSVDWAGNQEEPQTIEVKIDKTSPKLTVDLNSEYELGSQLNVDYITEDVSSKVASEQVLLTAPGEVIGKVINPLNTINLSKPGIYKLTVFVTDHAGNTQVVQKAFTVYIPAFIEVTPQVIKGNKGVFTLRAELPKGFDSKNFNLDTAQLNGVKALNSNNGYYNQAKQGQFKFERSDFNWTNGEQALEFRCYLNGYLVVGTTTVSVK
jgi:large repetitive protein